MKEVIEAAKAEFTRATDRVARVFAATPDDKINWSPSPTSRTMVQQVAHAAISIPGMQNWLAGNPFPFKDVKELDDYTRTKEREFTTREQAVSALEENSAAYLSWLDSLTDEQLNGTFETPMGSFAMADAITFPADHVRSHAAQMEYMQTIYGDMEWYMG